jgi:hypothetical protein
MNDSVHRAQVTFGAMKLMVNALESIIQQLPKNPELYAVLAESPLEDLRRLRDELDEHLEHIKPASAISSTAPIAQHTSSNPIAPGPIESTS